MGDRSEFRTLFLMTNPNLIQLETPTGPFGSKERTILVRAYPKQSEIVEHASSGSGFFVSTNLVATNFHVVKDAKQIRASVLGTTLEAKLVLKDARNELALLKLRTLDKSAAAKNIQGTGCLRIGDSDSVKAGDAVYAIGFPLQSILSTSASVGQGVVNNTSGIDNDPRMFQMSTPIQPGNSGGPLFDSYGKVVGIVTATLNNELLFKSTGTIAQNVNFAIKSSYLRTLIALANAGQCVGDVRTQNQGLTARDIQERYSKSVVQILTSR